jgi:hypothetical protein
MKDHHGRLLENYLKTNKIVVTALLKKMEKDISRATFYSLYHKEEISQEYINLLLRHGIDFLGQSPVTRLKESVQFTQKESGLVDRVRQLEAQMAQMQSAMLDLYSRLPKQA